MGVSDENLKAIGELKWISVEEKTLSEKIKSKGIFGILVPLGCLVTTGILASGIYSMFQSNSKKQQLLMRYRVLAQGITIGLATVGLLQHKYF